MHHDIKKNKTPLNHLGFVNYNLTQEEQIIKPLFSTINKKLLSTLVKHNVYL
jgi:hypothetical protein